MPRKQSPFHQQPSSPLHDSVLAVLPPTGVCCIVLWLTKVYHSLSPRVFKAQFARWGWSKYNCKRMRSDLSSGKAVIKSQGKSCYRVKRHRATKANNAQEFTTEDSTSSDASLHSPVSPASSATTQAATLTTAVVRRSSPMQQQNLTMPYQLGHVNDTTRFMQSILSDIRSHVCDIFTRQPNWQNSRATKIGLIKAYDYLSYDHFVIAMDAFLKNEHSDGGEILRHAFLEVEDAIQTDYSSTFYFLFIDLPDLFLRYNRHDILTILLGHITRLSSSVRLRDKIPGTGFAALHALAETDPSFLQHYITTASALWCDLLAELRGPRDRSTLLAKRNYLRHARGVNTAYRVGQLWDDYTFLMGEVHKQLGPGHDMSRHMEDVVLSTQLIHDYFVEGFVGQNERLLQSLENKYRIVGSQTHPPLPPTPSSTRSITTSPPNNGTATLPPTTTNILPRHTNISDPILALGPTTPSNPSFDVMNNNDGDDTTTTNNMNIVPVEAWDVLDRNIRSNCYHRLAYTFAHQMGDARRALYYTRKANEGWRYKFWQLEAESALVCAGRHFEAESLRRCRLEAQYFGKLPGSGEMIAAGYAEGSEGSGYGGGGDAGLGLRAVGIDDRLFVSTPSSIASTGMGRVVR